MRVYLGVDVGSVTTKVVALDEEEKVLAGLYLRTQGRPIETIQEGLRLIQEMLPSGVEVAGAGTTGSARYLAGVVAGADTIKNEITAHAVGALHFVPDVQTIVEIGGQDSKIIILRDGVVTDFGMNTVCAAGTGSFLDHQALRLNISIEEFGPLALQSKTPVRIAGRCTVFAESDMVHKQQVGHSKEDILYGLCDALVRNYLNNVALGKETLPPVVFQGGVAFNVGIRRALEEALKTPIIVPPHHECMGAIGAALLAKETVVGRGTSFKGFEVSQVKYRTTSFECKACANLCEIAQLSTNGNVLARWGGAVICGRGLLSKADIRIALDAMGGDHAPEEIVRGALQAREEGVGVVLVGREADISPYLPANLDGLRLVLASEVIGSHEPPVEALRLKPHSSIRVGLELVKRGEAHGFVSAGSTGAVAAAAVLVLGNIPGVERPALGLPYATPSGPAIILDVGANADCRPQFLLQFAHLGARYMERVWGIASPRIALLSSGEEEEKGNRLVRESHNLLKKSGLNFIGNLEGKDLLRGLAEVVVSDGFTGNVLIKATEGFGEAIHHELRHALRSRFYLRPLALLLRPALKEVVRKMDYNEYGGAHLLGVQGNVFVAHGRSKALAIKNALLMARRVANQGVLEALTEEKWLSLR